jgi:hypothetical protein
MPHSDAILTLSEATAILDPARPLIVSDADEVLLQFLAGLEIFLLANGARLDLTSFALTGNIKDVATGEPLGKEEVARLLRLFFETVDHLDAVPGSAEALQTLAKEAQILVLSNVPSHTTENRRRNLSRLGIHAPLISNDGLKGRALETLRKAVKGPMVFLDDLPPHLASVAELCPDVHLVHFVAHPRLAELVPNAPQCHLRTSNWHEARDWIATRLKG